MSSLSLSSGTRREQLASDLERLAELVVASVILRVCWLENMSQLDSDVHPKNLMRKKFESGF